MGLTGAFAGGYQEVPGLSNALVIPDFLLVYKGKAVSSSYSFCKFAGPSIVKRDGPSHML